MENPKQPTSDAPQVVAEPLLNWKEFLEGFPPEADVKVRDAVRPYSSGNPLPVVNASPIQLHCDSDECNGKHWFDHESGEIFLEVEKWRSAISVYRCRHCARGTKAFGLYVLLQPDSQTVTAYKIGEFPPFGPPTPSRVISLIGPDREIFLKGRRAELRGLGIGAFAYYRRVVENQKTRIIEEIEKVAKKIGAKPEVVEIFERAKKETQFSKAVDLVKSAIPESLQIDGHNPLTLLHTALSQGLHDEDDDTCLALAQDIRLVLTELAERISLALKEHAELTGAVSRILRQNSKTPA